MHELITIHTSEINHQEVNTVNARELHHFLEVDTRFNDWIVRRIEECQYQENEDYIVLLKNELNPILQGSPQEKDLEGRPAGDIRSPISGSGNFQGFPGGRPSKEYFLTIDMAKELSMLERSEMGRRARKYFIRMERQAIDQTELVDEMAKEILRARPMWKQILDYKYLGLNHGEIGRLCRRSKDTIRRTVRRMERFQMIDPPQQLARLQALAREQLFLPGKEG